MEKTIIAWGRMNPPTIGHQKLVDKVITTAKRERGEPRIYLSHTQSPKKDPLSYRDKIKTARKAFGPVVKVSASRTIIELMKELERNGYKDVVLVAGSDRVQEYKALLNKYNGSDYKFNSIKIVSAGERDPDAEGAEGMSATKMRQAAAAGDQKTFSSGVPTNLSKRDTTNLYNLTRKGMLVEEIEELMEKKKKEKDVDVNVFSDAELEKAVDDMQDEDLDLDIEEDLQERAPLTIQQRLKKARIMRRLAPRMKRLRQVKKYRMAPAERLQLRSRKLAKNLLRKKFAGQKGAHYSSLSPSEKITVDRLVANKSAVIDKLAKRLMPMIRRKEIARIKQARSSKNEHVENISKNISTVFESTDTKRFKNLFTETKTIKVGEDTVGAKETHYGLIKNRKVIATGSKKDMMSACENQGGRVWVTTKNIGDIVEGNAVQKARELIRREKDQDKKKHDAIMDRARTQDTRVANRKESFNLSAKAINALKAKALRSGIDYDIIEQVYYKGVESWIDNPKDKITSEQWGFARVNSFITNVKNDRKVMEDDLLEGGLWYNIHKKRKRIKAGSGERMRRPGEKGRPTAQDFKDASETKVVSKRSQWLLDMVHNKKSSANEESGAGEEGTTKLKDKYTKGTPGQ